MALREIRGVCYVPVLPQRMALREIRGAYFVPLFPPIVVHTIMASEAPSRTSSTKPIHSLADADTVKMLIYNDV